MHPEWAYLLCHKPFEEIGSDIFLTVSPGRIQLWVADADVINQITTRRNDFPKPLKLYKSLDLYGKSVVSTEGSTWRQHRKITAPSFSEKNNELVFTESLHHDQALLKLWTGVNGDESRTVPGPATDTMRFVLYVISHAEAAQKQTLSDSDIFGNAFVFMLAGHETIANALHFPLVLLALNWKIQRRL